MMRRCRALLVVLAGLAACRDDGGRDSDVADTSGGDDEADDGDDDGDDGDDDDAADDSADDAADDDPSGPSTDPDDTGPDPDDDGESTDPDTGPADSSESGDPVDPIDPDALDDEFDGDLDGWSTFNADLSAITVTNGELRMEPDAWTVWLDGSTASLVHKPVAGDFKVTAAVTARSLSNPSVPPPAGYRFGGLMARDGSGGAENYVFIVLGTDTDASVETKTTVDGSSNYQGPAWPGASGEVRICRVGDTFGMYVRNDGGAWQLSNTFDRPDLPVELDVGPIAYNNDATPNLRASFQFVDFEPVTGLDDCTE